MCTVEVLLLLYPELTIHGGVCDGFLINIVSAPELAAAHPRDSFNSITSLHYLPFSSPKFLDKLWFE